MTGTFVKIDGKDKYQDFWLYLREATVENFQSDLNILNKIQEKAEKKVEDIQVEKNRMFELMTMLKSTAKTGIARGKKE